MGQTAGPGIPAAYPANDHDTGADRPDLGQRQLAFDVHAGDDVVEEQRILICAKRRIERSAPTLMARR